MLLVDLDGAAMRGPEDVATFPPHVHARCVQDCVHRSVLGAAHGGGRSRDGTHGRVRGCVVAHATGSVVHAAAPLWEHVPNGTEVPDSRVIV